MIKVKRIYDKPSSGDGERILVDRLWPRGLKKADAAINEWIKDIAPSNTLRKWFAHDPDKWPLFKAKYKKELRTKDTLTDHLKNTSKKKTVTLLYASKDTKRNNAVVLKEFLEQ